MAGQKNQGINGDGFILYSSIIHDYVKQFNDSDNELYVQHVPNSSAEKFLSENIPLLECPDKEIERTYYFRWWTYRKHIRKTPGGFVITEFLPDVPWAGKYNTINCPALFHFNEGRWLHNPEYLTDYAYFWFRGGGNVRTYSYPVACSFYNHYIVTDNDCIVKELLPDLVRNFEEWEKEKWDPEYHLFRQIDDRDGMEVSICGSGFRATLNSYMAADAEAIARIAAWSDPEIRKQYQQKATNIKKYLFQFLWDEKDHFLKVLPGKEHTQLCQTRELHGYTPWAFNLADEKYAVAWKFLMDSNHFYAPFGPVTAEQSAPSFKLSYEGHECQWNGPSWPFATSITLMGLAQLLNNQQQHFITKEDYFELLKIYTRSHNRVKEDGTIVPWIDENINPFTGDWISRTRLSVWENGTWSQSKGGVERGKDYNHSAYCDLIITGLIGLQPQEGNQLRINPLLPEGIWEYFCLDHILYHGKKITILYDKTGKKYHRGKGLTVFVDGKKITSSPRLSTIVCKL